MKLERYLPHNKEPKGPMLKVWLPCVRDRLQTTSRLSPAMPPTLAPTLCIHHRDLRMKLKNFIDLVREQAIHMERVMLTSLPEKTRRNRILAL
jgi:hypothetical protein